MKTYNIESLKQLIDNAKTAFIAVPKASIDSIGSALAFAFALEKAGIKTTVFCPEKVDQNYSRLSGIETLVENYNLNDLTISLNYPLENIDQVSYNDNGGRLNLVVKTKNNSPKVEREQIIVNNQASMGDVNFLFGDEKDLGDKSILVQKGNWVNISPFNENKDWAKASIIDVDAPFSEIITFLLLSLKIDINVEIAKNLLIALRVATQSFSVNVSPETFEAGAICLRGAQTQSQTPNPIPQTPPAENLNSNPSNTFSPSNSDNNPVSMV
jgi:nanoRNase/pAp phosphatase (c-di-AMP/oligoRNAs hydrolase)